MKPLNLNEEQLQELEAFARLHFSLKSLAILLQLPFEQLQEEMQQEASVVRLAICRGRLLTEAKLRKTTFDLAENGSTPALNSALQVIQDCRLEDLL